MRPVRASERDPLIRLSTLPWIAQNILRVAPAQPRFELPIEACSIWHEGFWRVLADFFAGLTPKNL